MSTKEVTEQARAEGVLLGLWAKSLFRPTAELTQELREGVFVAGLRNLLGGCEDPTIGSALDVLDGFARYLQGKEVDAARLVLEVDYNRLFVGPSALLAPPYESFYKTTRDGERGRVRADSEREVNAEYAAHGLAAHDGFVDFSDHIAVELEYLSLLASQEADAWESGDSKTALSLQEDQELFRDKHLGSWIAEFARNVADGAKTTFYPSVTFLVQKTVF
ncbi:MAG: molecular chaperone [Coriobacteriia bacterium]